MLGKSTEQLKEIDNWNWGKTVANLILKVLWRTFALCTSDKSRHFKHSCGCLYEVRLLTYVSHLSEVIFIPRLHEKNIPLDLNTFCSS